MFAPGVIVDFYGEAMLIVGLNPYGDWYEYIPLTYGYNFSLRAFHINSPKGQQSLIISETLCEI